MVDPQLEAAIRHSPPTWALASRLKDAYQLPESEWAQVLKFQWTADDETWTVHCNGSGRPKLWTGTPLGGAWPDPSAVEVPAGCHLVTLDGEALLLAKPDGQEFYCEREETKHWEEAIIRAIHDRCIEKGDDLPDVRGFLHEKDGGDS